MIWNHRPREIFFYGILMQMRATTKPEEYGFMANSYLAEIEKMNAEFLNISSVIPAKSSPRKLRDRSEYRQLVALLDSMIDEEWARTKHRRGTQERN